MYSIGRLEGTYHHHFCVLNAHRACCIPYSYALCIYSFFPSCEGSVSRPFKAMLTVSHEWNWPFLRVPRFS